MLQTHFRLSHLTLFAYSNTYFSVSHICPTYHIPFILFPFFPKIIHPLFFMTLCLYERNIFLSEIHISFDRFDTLALAFLHTRNNIISYQILALPFWTIKINSAPIPYLSRIIRVSGTLSTENFEGIWKERGRRSKSSAEKLQDTFGIQYT